MHPLLQHRLIHHAALTLIVAILTLPNLGVSSLWDVDEAVNAEASREMLEKGTWVTPTFNFEFALPSRSCSTGCSELPILVSV